MDNEMSGGAVIGVGSLITVAVVGLLTLGLWGCPQYNVYQQRLAGEAELSHAEYSKQVIVQTATSRLEAAKLEAQTDVVRAEGIAKANTIISHGLGGPEGYLRWLYIEMLKDTAQSPGKTIIYIPTEAGLPILEAGRLEGAAK